MGARPFPQPAAGVTLMRHPAELERIVPAWEELAREALEPNPFYEPWMLLPALAAYAGSADLRVALVWEGAELAGLFPFERVARFKGLPAATLRTWLHPHCLLGTPLVRRGRCLEVLFHWLAGQCSLAEFRYVPAGEPFHQALHQLLAARGLEPMLGRRYQRGLLRKHRATISGRLRRTIARNERRLREHGTLAHAVLPSSGDIARWSEEFLRLEASGWKGREGSAMICSQPNRTYFMKILEAAFRRGRLLASGLELDGRPIARRTSFTAGAASYAFKLAYDEAFAEFSPGVMLELDNVRQLDAHPELQWMDSFTDGASLAVERMWPDQRTIETFAVAVRPWGELAAAALPALRWLKRRVA